MSAHHTRTGSVIDTDVCVIGGGPAGATIARRLALSGHLVCLVEKTRFPQPKIGESLSPNILPLLETLGLRERVEEASFLRPEKTLVRWSSANERPPFPSDPRGLMVDRGRFDQLLLEAAREAGVRILQPAQALRPKLGESGYWTLPVRCEAEQLMVRARYLVAATGRRNLLHGKRKLYSVPTIALYAYWRNAGIDPSAVMVEAGLDEWFWGATLPDGTFNAMVFTDPSRVQSSRGQLQGLESLYRSMLNQSSLIRGCLTGTLASKVKGCDASSYADEHPVDEHSIKVGEASFSIDPLSSQGVQAAINSGLQGSIVVHTLLTRPVHTAAAIQFYRDRQQETVAYHQLLAAKYYSESRFSGAGQFWQKRAGFGLKPLPVRLGSSPAFSVELRLCLSDAASLVTTPCITGDIITNVPALVHPELERPIAYLNNIEVLHLFESIAKVTTVADIMQAWSRYLSPLNSIKIIDWLYNVGVFVPTSKREGSGKNFISKQVVLDSQ
jgi:flavin-dependent dehydrogenase